MTWPHRRTPGRLAIGLCGLAIVPVAGAVAVPALVTAPAAHQAPSPAQDANAQLAASRAAALRASSVFVYGSTPVNRTRFTVRLTRDHRAHMRLLQGTKARLQVIRIGRRSFTLGNAAWYRSAGLPPAAARERAGKWFQVPAAAVFAELLDKQLLVGPGLVPTGAARVSGTGTLRGRPVTFFRDADENGTIAVRSSGVPYPVNVDYDAKDSGIIWFAEWGARTRITAPERFTPLP